MNKIHKWFRFHSIYDKYFAQITQFYVKRKHSFKLNHKSLIFCTSKITLNNKHFFPNSNSIITQQTVAEINDKDCKHFDITMVACTEMV